MSGPAPATAGTLRLAVAYGEPGNPGRITRTTEIPWNEYAAELLKPPPVSDDKASRGWSIPATFHGARRDGDSLLARSALTFDFDTITMVDVPVIERALEPFDYLLYTTASHTADKPRLRAVLPLSRPASPEEFCAVSRRVAESIIELASRESHAPAQMMFLPTVKPGQKFKAKRHTGKPVDVDAILASYADWTDRASWPRRAEHDDTRKPAPGTDPRQKPGTVGDFCRAYSVPEAIEAFGLPYRHEHGNRWTYTNGHSKDGAVVYDDGTKLHSHHDTDPARGQHNAFDLVRLHKYGHLDADAAPGTPVHELPSHRAMATEAAERPEVQSARVAEFDVLAPLPPTDAPPNFSRTLREVLAEPGEVRWLLDDVLEKNVIAIVAGPRGSYKSFIALDWAMRIALSGHRVYVISAEGGDFGRRAEAWVNTYAPHERETLLDRLVIRERRVDLDTKDGCDAVLADCKARYFKPDLLVLDTFSKLSGGLDENDNTAVKAFIGRLDNAFRCNGMAVLLIAHTGHTEKGRPRGASALGADTDAEYIVSRTPSTVKVTRERFKSSPELPPLFLRAEVVDLGRLDARGKPVTSLVMRPAEPSRGPKSVKEPSGTNQKAVYAAIPETGDIREAEIIDKALPYTSHDPREPDTVREARKSLRKALRKLLDDGILSIKPPGLISRTRIVSDSVGAELADVATKAEVAAVKEARKK